MNRLKTGHVVEFVLWVALAAVLYAFSFDFDQEIEIYKYGASAWPRVVLILVVVAAAGQLFYNARKADDNDAGVVGSAAEAGTDPATAGQRHDTRQWYLATIGVLALPLVYVLAPEWIAATLGVEKAELGAVKMIVAAVVLAVYLLAARGNHVGAMLALPIMFAVGLQDFGFYALAPVFILGVMYLMGERRPVRMVAVAAFTFSVLVFLFVTVLYVGLPAGNVHPFYDFGTALITILQ